MIIIIIKKLKKSSGMEAKINLQVNHNFYYGTIIKLQVNHNLSEIRQLFNPQTDRMGNRRKQEKGWGGGGLGYVEKLQI